jgi:hypothetical protein
VNDATSALSLPTSRLLDDRALRLFVMLAGFFCVNAVLAEFIGVKIFALEDTPSASHRCSGTCSARADRSASPPARCCGRWCS